MIAYDNKLKISVLKCDRCGKIFTEGGQAEICQYVSELRALSIKYGWQYRKFMKDGDRSQVNLCPKCSNY